ncbi:MAG TPA: prephenate dehydratase [Candidatus Binataceae bacterium]|nr:prephenate dehydratase [Candidatus Binataceae bacterium]
MATVKAVRSVSSVRPPRTELTAARERIDAINQTLLKLLNERARLAIAIGHLKRAQGAELYQPAREQAILERLIAQNEGPLRTEDVRHIFGEIISACRGLEHELRVAYLGPEFTYSHLAAIRQFGHGAQLQGEESIAAVFAALDGGRADLALAPVENSTEGSVTVTLDALLDSPAQIVGEVLLPVRHALLSLSGRRADIKKILAHQQSLGQCRDYLSTNFPGCVQEAVASNALAARRAAADPTLAAIAAAEAAQPYGLRVVAHAIQDQAHNMTRFLILGRQAVAKSGNDKTSVIFAMPERVGALKEALTVFARNRIDLTMIQSRPQRGRPWAYLFYADLRGHREAPAMKRALAALKRKALFLKLLGSYPEARVAG